MKALITFSLGSLVFNQGDEIHEGDLTEAELAYLQDRKLVSEDEGEEGEDPNLDDDIEEKEKKGAAREKQVIKKPGKRH